MKTIILGKESILTTRLKENLKNCEIISTRKIENVEILLNKIKKYKKINLIFNNFYPSKKLGLVNENIYSQFYDQSINFNAKLFGLINKKKINKVIYTSSASIYNSISHNYISVDGFNRKLYASTKINNENLIYNFCSKNNINYTIARIFNMYGSESDKFSIVSKIIECFKKNKIIKIFHGGNNIRDFIHINDVVKVYIHILKNVKKNTVIDVGTGKGSKIVDVINLFTPKLKYKKISVSTEEINISIANLSPILNIYKNFKPMTLDYYLMKELKYKSNKKLFFYKREKHNLIQDTIEEYIIYGAGNAGLQIHNRLINDGKEVYCFVDDNKSNQNKLINGKKVLSFNQLQMLSAEKTINDIIIAIPSLSSKNIIELKEKLKFLCNNVSFLPEKKNLMSDYISLSDIGNEQISNFLNRKVVKISRKKFKKLENKVVLVTGAAGSIGSELCRQLLTINAEKIIALDNSELLLFNLRNELNNFKKKIIFSLNDVTSFNTLDRIIKKHKVNFVFHAAAYKHVGILEENILPAIKNNIFGTLTVLETCNKNNCNLVMISTDKAIKPTSILGLTKRIAEISCLKFQKLNPKSNISIVRFGNVFGSLGSAVPKFLEQLNKGLPITITNKNVKRYFMTIKEACYLVLQTTILKKQNNTFVLNMGKPIKILEILKKLIIIKKSFNPEKDYKIREIGLQKGEKLEEILSLGRTFKTENLNIFLAKDPVYDNKSVESLIQNLKKYYESANEKKIILLIKKFLRREYLNLV